ncbi:TonB-dependent siderophore receptor [Gallaecimonas mangrovi]|uniref:TonB-dependent siderophore receptor n=1 Tax=Gallaecimonas mangrovi TaxID=2291597 RepID=UPI000E20091E|nr:TonB-dependent siderophore receptor [Gallaecimonas mangrovi]
MLNKVSTAALACLAVSPLAMAQSQSDSTSTQKSQKPDEHWVVYGQQQQGDDYRAKRVDLGPFGSTDLKKVPYSVTVLSQHLLQSQQITSLNDALKFMPSTQMEARGGLNVGRPQSRGMEGSVVDNSHLDGLNVVATTAQPIELIDHITVINGLTGALYGPASPAGDFNYTAKRPTAQYRTVLSSRVTAKGALTESADFGGSPSQYFGYRLNVLHENGNGYVPGSTEKRKLAGWAFNFNLTPKLQLQLDGSYYDFQHWGYPGGFGISAGVALPKAPDPSRKGYGQSWAGQELKTTTNSAKLLYQLNDNWQFEGGYLHQQADRTLPGISNSLNGDGTYTSTVRVTNAAASRFSIDSNMAKWIGQFATGAVTHKLVVGTTGYDWGIYKADTSSVSGASTVTLGTSSLDDPRLYSSPQLYTDLPLEKASSTRVQSGMLGDTIGWTDRLSTLLVASYSHFNLSSSNYKKDGLSSTVSVIYQLTPAISTYATHADTLESGGAASSSADNAGTLLDPIRSRQSELGMKATVGNLDTGLAVFHITRPMAYTGDDNVYKVQGLQRNNGLELSLGGAISEQLKIFGGATWLDARLKDAAVASNDDKQVVGVPRFQSNLLFEYDFAALPGLAATTNLHYTGKRAANSSNSTWAAGYRTVDMGASYRFNHFYGKQLTLRFNVTNLTDEHYWASLFAGSITGSSDSASAFLGAPRQFVLSATLTL